MRGFASITLTHEEKESSLLLLNNGEMCVAFVMALRVIQEKELAGFRSSGETYDALLNYRGRRATREVSEALYRTDYRALPEFLVVTNELCRDCESCDSECEKM